MFPISGMFKYAESIMNDLETIGVNPPSGFHQAFMREARHLGLESVEDFGSAYLLECLRAKREGSVDAEFAPLKALHTVRRRLVRQSQKARQAQMAALSKELEGRGTSRPQDPTEIAEFADALRLLLSQLDVREKVLLEGMLQDKSLKESALEAEMSYDAARQAASRLKKKIRPWLARFEDLVKR